MAAAAAVAAAPAAADGAMLTRDWAVALQQQLLTCYSQPQFQEALNEIMAATAPVLHQAAGHL